MHVPTSNTLAVQHEHDDGKLFVKLYCNCNCIHEGLISCVRGPLFNTLETQEAVEAQLHKRILRNDCQREDQAEVVKWTSGTCVMYYIPRVPSFPASVTCDLCSLSDRSVL